MKLAACQIDVAFGDVAANQAAIERERAAAADAGAALAVVPECPPTAYPFPPFPPPPGVGGFFFLVSGGGAAPCGNM